MTIFNLIWWNVIKSLSKNIKTDQCWSNVIKCSSYFIKKVLNWGHNLKRITSAQTSRTPVTHFSIWFLNPVAHPFVFHVSARSRYFMFERWHLRHDLDLAGVRIFLQHLEFWIVKIPRAAGLKSLRLISFLSLLCPKRLGMWIFKFPSV